MSNEDYLKDISEIKNLMNKSSRFISLSGLSGVLAGIYALVGAAANPCDYLSTFALNVLSVIIPALPIKHLKWASSGLPVHS